MDILNKVLFLLRRCNYGTLETDKLFDSNKFIRGLIKIVLEYLSDDRIE